MNYILSVLFSASVAFAAVQTYRLHEEQDRSVARALEINSAVVSAELRVHEVEVSRRNKLKEIEDETTKKIEMAASDVADAKYVSSKLRAQLANYTKQNSRDSTVTCPSTASKLEVLGELFQGIDEAAGKYAAEADEARVRGLTCEASYGALEVD